MHGRVGSDYKGTAELRTAQEQRRRHSGPCLRQTLQDPFVHTRQGEHQQVGASQASHRRRRRI